MCIARRFANQKSPYPGTGGKMKKKKRSFIPPNMWTSKDVDIFAKETKRILTDWAENPGHIPLYIDYEKKGQAQLWPIYSKEVRKAAAECLRTGKTPDPGSLDPIDVFCNSLHRDYVHDEGQFKR
jgi:hypothetical protein